MSSEAAPALAVAWSALRAPRLSSLFDVNQVQQRPDHDMRTAVSFIVKFDNDSSKGVTFPLDETIKGLPPVAEGPALWSRGVPLGS